MKTNKSWDNLAMKYYFTMNKTQWKAITWKKSQRYNFEWKKQDTAIREFKNSIRLYCLDNHNLKNKGVNAIKVRVLFTPGEGRD